MRCWACSHPIKLVDEVALLPVANALVHRACYEREVRQPVSAKITLSQFLAQGPSRAA